MAAPNKPTGEPFKKEPVAPKVEPVKAPDFDFPALGHIAQSHAVEAEKLAHAAFRKGDTATHAYYNALANALGTVAGIVRGHKG